MYHCCSTVINILVKTAGKRSLPSLKVMLKPAKIIGNKSETATSMYSVNCLKNKPEAVLNCVLPGESQMCRIILYPSVSLQYYFVKPQACMEFLAALFKDIYI